MDDKKLFIPLPLDRNFYYASPAGSALPIAALQYNKINIKIDEPLTKSAYRGSVEEEELLR